MSTTEDRYAVLGFAIIGIAVYLVYLLGAFLYHRYNPVTALSLAVSAWFEPPGPQVAQEDRQLRISGVVLENGKPAAQGRVRISVEDWEKGVRQSVFLDVKDGAFQSGNQPAFRSFLSDDRLRILAEYSKDGAAASEEVYLGTRVPRVSTQVAGFILLTCVVVSLGFLWLFTGPPVPGKNTLAIMVSYLVMIVFLGVPLVMPDVVSIMSPETMAAMQETPVGILVADNTPDPGKGGLERQWVLNIGGTVMPATHAVVTSATSSNVNPPSPQTSTADSSTDAQTQDKATQTGEPGEAGPAQTSPSKPANTPPHSAKQTQRDETTLTIQGGLVIPLYVLILSLIGGAINMTRKLPDFQKDAATLSISPRQAARDAYAAVSQVISAAVDQVKPRPSNTQEQDASNVSEPASAEKLGAINGTTTQSATTETDEERLLRVTGDWRKGLITQHMYLLSAPFLAIAVYYLLAWLDLLKRPVLVLVSFSVGLISDKILGRILGIAGDLVETARPGKT